MRNAKEGNLKRTGLLAVFSQALAYKISAQSTVLLKNENDLLPLDKTKKLKVALIGAENATFCAI
jgi:beta-glucosidase-like glycosyl hydrolase